MEYDVTVVDDHGRATPVVIEAGPAATVKALRTALPGPAHELFLDGRALPDGLPLAEAGITAG
ncbi:MAG: hypothetical protein ACRDT6_18820, partial [Micromonosporaceae bacterium]